MYKFNCYDSSRSPSAAGRPARDSAPSAKPKRAPSVRSTSPAFKYHTRNAYLALQLGQQSHHLQSVHTLVRVQALLLQVRADNRLAVLAVRLQLLEALALALHPIALRRRRVGQGLQQRIDAAHLLHRIEGCGGGRLERRTADLSTQVHFAGN